MSDSPLDLPQTLDPITERADSIPTQLTRTLGKLPSQLCCCFCWSIAWLSVAGLGEKVGLRKVNHLLMNNN